MSFEESILEAIREVVLEHFSEGIESAGYEVDDFVDTVMDTLDDSIMGLSDLISETIDAEIG